MTNKDFYGTYENAVEAWNAGLPHDEEFDAWLNAEHHINETLLKKTPIFSLVEKEGGPAIGFNPVGINSKNWVTMIVEKDGKFLCVKQLRYGLMREMLELPCGMVESGEDPLDAALRELEEETGCSVEAENVKFLGKYAANPAFMNNFMHYYYVNLDKCKYDQHEQHLDEHEKLTVSWMNKNEFVEEFIKSCGSAIMGCALWLLSANKII